MSEEKNLINPIYFVDDKDKTEKGLINPVKFENQVKKGPESKKYLILFCFYSSEEEGDNNRTYEIVTGRTNARQLIKNNIEDIDIHESKILVEGVVLEDMISIYEFMKHIEINYSDGFDIEDYNLGDVEYNEDEDDNIPDTKNMEPSFAPVLNPTIDSNIDVNNNI